MSTANIDELIKQVIAKLNLEEDVVKKAIGAVIVFLKDNVGEDFDFAGKILTKLQGSDALVEEAKREKEAPKVAREGESVTSTSSIIGIIKAVFSLIPNSIWDIFKTMLKKFFGENAVKMIESAGDGAEVVATMDRLGVSKEQASSMVGMLVTFMKTKLGDGVVDEITEQVPIVKKFLDSAKKDE